MTYNEKLQWLKLHDRNPLYTTLVDKHAVKDWVAERIGPKHIAEAYACWSSVEDIDLSVLPERFVLKTNHDSGGVAICRDRSTFDLAAAKRKLAKHLAHNYYWPGREWVYKNVRPSVFAEEYIEGLGSHDLPDYKFLCFDGKVRALYVATERFSQSGVKFDFFDTEYSHLPIVNGHPNAGKTPGKPRFFDEMMASAERLSQGIPHVRVDFYETRENYYFGEMTFYHMAGFAKFEPEEWDYTFGEWLRLPS